MAKLLRFITQDQQPRMKEAANMSDTNERPVASAGSVAGEPVAWAVVSDSTEEIDCEFVYPDEATAGDVALDSNGGVVPLYRHPQATLTDAERRDIKIAADAYAYADHDPDCERIAATLRGLLERLK